MLPESTDISASNTCDGATTEKFGSTSNEFYQTNLTFNVVSIIEIMANFGAIFWLPLFTTEIALS
jgi:hypothetical protein